MICINTLEPGTHQCAFIPRKFVWWDICIKQNIISLLPKPKDNLSVNKHPCGWNSIAQHKWLPKNVARHEIEAGGSIGISIQPRGPLSLGEREKLKGMLKGFDSPSLGTCMVDTLGKLIFYLMRNLPQLNTRQRMLFWDLRPTSKYCEVKITKFFVLISTVGACSIDFQGRDYRRVTSHWPAYTWRKSRPFSNASLATRLETLGGQVLTLDSLEWALECNSIWIY